MATLNTLALSSTAVTVDFTALSTTTYGTNAQRIINSKQVLWPGNTNGVDGSSKRRVIYQGNGNDLTNVFSQVLLESGNTLSLPTYIVQRYQTGDVNLDGEIRYQGPDNDLQTIFSTVILYSSLDVTYDITYIVQEQIP
ncbi:hypothetical protein [Spirosoma panaciterrae]|uniref:hypothetical protein n=1 Tax=Spirosoma panaciterrae TaxID=496058 RepID=UPI00037A15BD|nr:hypothetical protein [Spirosoma panaciterrae]